MQVFTLKLNDSLVIGGDIVIELAAIRGDTVRLECVVPRDVSIDQTEIGEAGGQVRGQIEDRAE